ncbi:hypothetical protein LINPERHAP2_LOCUS21354, partial [Linum perenne]
DLLSEQTAPPPTRSSPAPPTTRSSPPDWSPTMLLRNTMSTSSATLKRNTKKRNTNKRKTKKWRWKKIDTTKLIF